MTFRTPAEAIERPTTRPWTGRRRLDRQGLKIFEIASKLKAGVVWLNTYNKFDAASPFGGFKGIGLRPRGRAARAACVRGSNHESRHWIYSFWRALCARLVVIRFYLRGIDRLDWRAQLCSVWCALRDRCPALTLTSQEIQKRAPDASIRGPRSVRLKKETQRN